MKQKSPQAALWPPISLEETMRRLQSQPNLKPRRLSRQEKYEEPIQFAPPPVPGQLRLNLDFEDQEGEKEDE
jgi:hypothetical protein